MKFDFEALIIGSGFGGAISALRLSKKWPGRVMLVERGKRYGFGGFPRSPSDMANNFFNLPSEGHRRPEQISPDKNLGLFDIRSYEHMDVVMAAGYGGGSLVYANVFLDPPSEVFDERWPEGCKRDDLLPYYKICKSVMGSRKIPAGGEWELEKVGYYQNTALKLNRESELVDINVFFGNDPEKPLGQGLQEVNRYGALQSSCNYCAECDIGCNIRAKNTLDLNYLHAAEHRYGLNVLTEQKATRITPIGKEGFPSPGASGEYGYVVEVTDLNNDTKKSFRCRRVVVSAGTLGTNELLLRCRDEYQTLPKISANLGRNFSGNGDFLAFIAESDKKVEPTRGPVITQRIDFNLFKNFDPKRAFIMEDASYPNLVAWFVEGEKPTVMKISALWQGLVALVRRILKRGTPGRMGGVLQKLFSGSISRNSSVHLCMGYDESDGNISLDQDRNLRLHWPFENSMRLYEAIMKSVADFSDKVKARFHFALPTWNWPLRRNVTVHALGGCRLAGTAEDGVTDSAPERFGQVFSYENLYVADGSLLPSAVGANPALTISALAERVAEGITGDKPDDQL